MAFRCVRKRLKDRASLLPITRAGSSQCDELRLKRMQLFYALIDQRDVLVEEVIDLTA